MLRENKSNLVTKNNDKFVVFFLKLHDVGSFSKMVGHIEFTFPKWTF